MNAQSGGPKTTTFAGLTIICVDSGYYYYFSARLRKVNTFQQLYHFNCGYQLREH